ncbi:MAG TPA: hypothetical protein PK956_03125 [Burkholderiaceae bacterium]|jgi:hypothetical protein|nr:hypothetical protein [Burkholderiaceae bacterium]HRA77776.1 hypothetical protein [Burkholderiaceae bacterium]
MSSTHTVAWKYPDGTGGQCRFGEYESAFAYMLVVAEQSPQARVWFDDDVIQRGYAGDDEWRRS